MNHQVTIRPRTLANLLDDLRHARRDYDDAISDPCKEAEDRANEAETRLADMRAEFDVRFAEVNGLSVEDIRSAFADAVI